MTRRLDVARQQAAFELLAGRYDRIPRRRTDPAERAAALAALAQAGVKRDGRIFYSGPFPEQCRRCSRGRSYQLHLTLSCNLACAFCSNRDVNFLPEARDQTNFRSDADALKRIRKVGAEECSLAGGEPLMALGRTLRWIKLLRREFGPDFRIDLYTNGLLADELVLDKLARAGVNMIRFNLAALSYKTDRLRLALGYPWTVGAELPVIPQDEKKAAKAILELGSMGAGFVNLHELMFGRDNVPSLMAMGLLAEDSPGREFPERKIPVWGSEAAAFRLLLLAARRAKNLSVAYCSNSGKNKLIARQMRRLDILKTEDASTFASARKKLDGFSLG